jgi:hypothetical protein
VKAGSREQDRSLNRNHEIVDGTNR